MQRWVRDHISHSMDPPEWDALLSREVIPKLPKPRAEEPAATSLARRMWRSAEPRPRHRGEPDLAALHAQHKQAAKADRFLEEVDRAIQEGDQFVAYKVLKQLRPWQPSQKAQLKDSRGYLLRGTYRAEEVRHGYPRLRDNFVGLPRSNPPCWQSRLPPSNRGRLSSKGQRRSVQRLRLRVNLAKCSSMVKLSGTEAPSVANKHTCCFQMQRGN